MESSRTDTCMVPHTWFQAPAPHQGCAPALSQPVLQQSWAQLPAGPSQGLAWAPPCRDPLVCLPAEGGKGTRQKKSRLLQSSPTHSPCSKGKQENREEWRIFMATIWSTLALLEEKLGKPSCLRELQCSWDLLTASCP